MFSLNLLLFILSILSFAGKASALPSGSPVCDVDDPSISSVHKSQNLGFSIKPSQETITPGKPITFTVSGSSKMKGILIYVQDKSGKHVGTFNNLGANLRQVSASACKSYTSLASTITHKKQLTDNVSLSWTLSDAESKAGGEFTIKAIIAGGDSDTPNYQKLAPITLKLASTSYPAATARAAPTKPRAHATPSTARVAPTKKPVAAKKCKPKKSYGQ